MGWYEFTHTVESSLSNKFESLGRSVTRNPAAWFVSTLILSFGCMAGLATMTSKSAIVDLWVPADSEAKINYDYIDKVFATSTNDVNVIFTAPNGNDNILKSTYFDILWEADALVRSLSITFEGSEYSYADLCMKNSIDLCDHSGSLEFWSHDKATYDAITPETDANLLAALAIDNYPGTGENVIYNPDCFGGDIAKDSNGYIQTAQSVKVTWWLQNQQACIDDYLCPELDFMTKFQEEMEKFVLTKAGEVNMAYHTSRALDDALGEAIGADIPLVGAAYIIMIITCCLSLGKGIRHGCSRSSASLAGGGIFCVFLSTFAGFGIAALTGAWFTSLHSLLPFILVGIGVDDMYVIVNHFQLTRESLDLEDRVGIAMKNAGIPILYTSVTDFIAFLLGSTSSLKGISSFCVYAAWAILFDFFLQCTMFVAILVWDHKRKEAKKMDCCICIGAEDMYIRTVSDAFEYFAIWLDKYWLAVVVIFLAWFGVGVWASTENTEGFDPNKLVLDDSFFKTYNIMNKKYGMSTYDAVAPVAIYLPDVDLTVKENQLKIMELTESATLLENSNGPKSEWIVSFLTYLGTQSDICSTAPGTACEYTSTGVDLTDDQIKSKIVSFLAVDEYKVWATDLSLSTDNSIEASRTWLFHDKIDGVTQQIDAMNQIVNLCNAYTGFEGKKVFADSWIYVYVYQFVVFFEELMTNFGLVLLAVLITSPIVLKQPIATLLLIITVAMIDTELYGIVYLYGDNVNSLTGLGLVMAVGLVVDYNAHIIHAFFCNSDPDLTTVERLRLTMKQMARSVFFGGMTSFVGLLPLAFSQCEVFRVFFKMVLAIIILGLAHGLIFMPAVLAGLKIKPPNAMAFEEGAKEKYRGGAAKVLDDQVKVVNNTL
ncbi:hypothetical protein TL16_g04716 [Triparma laevis f. inornata]|uniref:SSD domain-containing protein n=1 Tax=Triparma laevis f. inornata TaxID=1714386 RepID=A0A9W7AH00_9STRA|nr:hypothetical protein TL16_g04716 [Triparma laevis f. inornata]